MWQRGVAISSDYKLKIQNESVTCSYSLLYKSVLIHGKVSKIDNLIKKEDALNLIMAKHSNRTNFTYNIPAPNNVSVFEILIDKIEGRSFGY